MEEMEKRNVLNPNLALNRMNDIYANYVKLQQSLDSNKTERDRIQAQKEIMLRTIANEKEKMMRFFDYLDRRFDERAETFKEDLKVIDNAIANGNAQLLESTIKSMNNLAAQSPLTEIASIAKTRNNLLSGRETLDI